MSFNANIGIADPTVKAFTDSLKNFTSGVTNYAHDLDERGASAVNRGFDAIPGALSKARETAKLTSADMNEAVFESSPLGTAIGGAGISLGKAFLGWDEEKEKEDDSTVISKEDGAGEDLSKMGSAFEKFEELKHISNKMTKILNKVDSIEISVRDNSKLAKEQKKRAQRNRAKAEEARREAAAAIVPEGEDGEGAPTDSGGGVLGGMLSGLGGMFNQIPGFKTISALFRGGLRGITKLFGKLFWPITIAIGIFSFADGFAKGFDEGGLQEGFTQGFEKLIENLIDVPLNFFKDLVAFVAGLLGFKDFEEKLNETEIDASSFVRPIIDGIVEMYNNVVEFLTKIKDALINFDPVESIKDMGTAAADAITGFFGIGGDEEGSETPPPAKPTPASAPKKSSPSENIQLTEGFESLDPFKQEALLLGPKLIDPMQEYDLMAGKQLLFAKTGYEYDTADKLARDMGYDFDAVPKVSSFSPQADALAQTTGGDRRAGAAAAIQDAGVSSGMAGGGAAPTVIIDQKDQSVRQAGSNLIPAPFNTQTDPAMSQSIIGDL